MERVTSIDSNKSNATNIIVIMIIFVIAMAIVSISFITISFNSWGHKLEERGYVREKSGPYHGFYKKDDLRVRVGSDYLVLVERVDSNYNPSTSFKLVKDMLNIDISHMKEFLTTIAMTGSYQELESFTYNGKGYMYSLSVEYLDGGYDFEQTIDFTTYDSSSDLAMDSITIKLNDNADRIFDDFRDLFIKNFNDSSYYKYYYIFKKYCSNNIPLNDTYFTVRLGENLMSGSYLGNTLYIYTSISKFKDHEIYTTYPKELFVEKYKEIINDDFKIIGINSNKEEVYSFIENIINGKDTYKERELVLEDTSVLYINKFSDKYEVSYDYKHIN